MTVNVCERTKAVLDHLAMSSGRSLKEVTFRAAILYDLAVAERTFGNELFIKLEDGTLKQVNFQ